MRRSLLALVCVTLVAGCSTSSPVASGVGRVAAKDLGDLAWRWVGPAVMGGRLDAVQGVPGDPATIYLGHSSGGLFKSTDGGLTFDAIFKAGDSTAIGAVAVAESNPKVVFVGTGEGFPRNTASPGDGVYTSIDAGKTWKFSGLRDSEHIAKIAIDPRDPKVAIVAALGREWVPGGERGIYRTQDGGASWQRVIYINATTGGSDVAFDPQNPNVVYAGTFDFIRRPWTFRGGGPGSALFRSSDNGRTWVKLTDPSLRNGLPGGIVNRVGVSVSYNHPDTVYALVPTKIGMLYRSDDAGMHWRLVNASQDINFRPFYFSQVRADPDDPNRVYVLTGELKLSTNGGKTFKDLSGGGDNHDLWIDPKDHKRLLLGSDMGLDMSLSSGDTWDYVNSVPFAQIYRVGYDLAVPYHLMGGMQDHEVWWGPNTMWNDDGADGGAWRNISDWGDGQYAMADPSDPNIVYEDTHFGDLTRRNLLTGEARYISPQPIITFGTGVGSFRYRFNWSAPLLISAHDPGTLYFGGNVLFKSGDEGSSWRAISPDLGQPCDRSKLGPSGGPIGHDNTNAESYCTIYAISEDVRDANTIWAGTDDGNLDITRDGGAHWNNVIANVPGLGPDAWVSSLHASSVTSGVAYASFDRHRVGDVAPHVYRTDDYGSTWHDISRGLRSYVYVVRDDPRQPNLLFAGTEEGVYASFDRGRSWLDLRLGMNHVPVYDLAIQPRANDLILGTHGRGFYVLDDITPLEGLAAAVHAGVMLFAPMPAWRFLSRPGTTVGRGGFTADNKPYGATIAYYLPPLAHAKKQPKKKPAPEKIRLEIRDAGGKLVRTLDGAAGSGIHRVTWDLGADPPGGKDTIQDPRGYYVFYPLEVDGPQALPGRYSVTLLARGRKLSQPLDIVLDPASKASSSDLAAQYDALWTLGRMQERCEVTVNEIAGLDRQIDRRTRSLKDGGLRFRLATYRKRVDAFADRLRNGDGTQNSGYKQPAQLIDRIAYQTHLISTYYGPPTQPQRDLIDAYGRQVDAAQKESAKLFTRDLAPVNAALKGEKLAPLIVKVTPAKKPRGAPDP